LSNLSKDSNRIITNTDCQYYIDLESTEYSVAKDANNDEILPFYLPNGFSLYYVDNSQYLYTDARAERYGFAHQTEYIPQLDRYVYKYYKRNENGNGYMLDDGGKPQIYYGYYNSKYYSPSLIQSIVTNSRFNSTSGWIGTKTEQDV
jgi:hypothetical protein